MPKAASSGKASKKLKMSVYIPATVQGPVPVGGSSTSTARTLQTTKLKTLTTGGFKIATLAALSGVHAPDVSINDHRTTEEILASWVSASEQNGWDRAYMESFLERDLAPPTEDTESEDEDKRTRKRPTGQGDKAIHDWVKHIDLYLRYLITLEGRGKNPPTTCPNCTLNQTAEYRCLTCDDTGMMCKECIVSAHRSLPLHRTQRWNGNFFAKVTLKSLGLRIQLGHSMGETCPRPDTAWGDDFVVLDMDGVHTLGVDYCGCGGSPLSQMEQLLDRRFYPATTINPKSAATFRLLELFEILQYESKDRYPSFLRMVHEWRHLKLLKRNQRGHDPERGAAETKEGECAVLCPPCPHPGINMPEGWENEPEETRYIHALNLALDACFRLKRKDVSSDEADPGLSRGYSYFVNPIKFTNFLKQHEDEVEPKSTCSRHDAVNLADVTPGQGYAASGVATVECARHNMKRPSAVCDLQKGERYCNMDYILHWSLVVLALGVIRTIFISYDIACQWSKHLFERITKIDKESPLLAKGTKSRFLVPKFHLPAHIAACQTKFAFMLTPGAGLGDGEAPERGWGEANPLAPSTREMGPGSRRDTLDYNFGDYNWRKVVDLGSSLKKKMDTAVSKVAEHTIAHQELEAMLDPEKVKDWTEKMVAWEKDPVLNANPFEITVSTPTQAAVRKALADEEAAALAAGKDVSLSPDISPSVLISRGIDLEADQRALRVEMKKTWTHSRDRELTRVQLHSNTLIRRIDAWYQTLQLYIPSTALLRQKATGPKTIPPYDLSLWLPSQIGKQAPVDKRLTEIEYQLRAAQAQEALTSLRRGLQRRITVHDLKKRWLRGQGPNTKALNLLSTIEAQIATARDEYRRARVALLALGKMLGKAGLDAFYLPLEDGDIRAMVGPDIDDIGTAQDPNDRTGATRRVSSWIWRHASAAEDNHTEYEAQAIKVDWAKSRARAARYQEEIKIVREEMNRALRFLEWKEAKWYERAGARQAVEEVSSEYDDGLRAYARRQGSICLSLKRRFEHAWGHVDSEVAAAYREIKDPRLFYDRKRQEEGQGEQQGVSRPSDSPMDVEMSSRT
ncbi:hypothetical protein DFP72DRAFT_1064583 [Ephemerocybe angulata]|uniref:CxC2-like cysteine cluster KDZ transposase-associated domain-containing protein n=1 Tax=Ephemerocybe angulata TaxID=980116 RepID=A0A8H6I5U7_9AGAR|nr:hypothetical protein DFP72DRAFT_1064583 [Tulosesus angulatus]